MRRLAAFIVGICLPLPALAAAPAVNAWDLSAKDGFALHRASRLSFPAEVPGAKRSGTVAKPAPAIMYAGDQFPSQIAFTLTLARQQGTPAAALQRALTRERRMRSRLRVDQSGPVRLGVGEVDVDGSAAVVGWSEGKKEMGAWLLVLPSGSYLIRVRAAYERGANGIESGWRLRATFNQIATILRTIRRAD